MNCPYCDQNIWIVKPFGSQCHGCGYSHGAKQPVIHPGCNKPIDDSADWLSRLLQDMKARSQASCAEMADRRGLLGSAMMGAQFSQQQQNAAQYQNATQAQQYQADFLRKGLQGSSLLNYLSNSGG